MATEPANYEAVLADLESKKSQIENAITVIRSVMGLGLPVSPNTPSGPGGGGPGNSTPQPDAFLGMSIPEAAKKHLTATRRKLGTQELMNALEAGGLPKSKYTTVYGVLRRRQENVGDIISVDGDWALASWYPNHAGRRSKKGADSAETPTDNGTPAASEAEGDPAENAIAS